MKKTNYKKVSDLLTNHRRWCKNSNRAPWGRCCLAGATSKVYPEYDKYQKIIQKLLLEVQKLGYIGISHFNDDPKTTFKDIQKLVKKLNV